MIKRNKESGEAGEIGLSEESEGGKWHVKKAGSTGEE